MKNKTIKQLKYFSYVKRHNIMKTDLTGKNSREKKAKGMTKIVNWGQHQKMDWNKLCWVDFKKKPKRHSKLNIYSS